MQEPTGPNLLLVEGQDDLHVVRHLCNRQGYEPKFQIIPADGYPNLQDMIYGQIRSPDCHVLGIMADANNDPRGRWESISGMLMNVGISGPDAIGRQGTIIDAKTRVGIWLMPDNRTQGELEDFVIEMIPDGDPVWPLAKNYIDGISIPDRKFADGKISTAYLYAWLATREEPPRMGAAIGQSDLSAEGPLATSFVNWLRQLFS